MQYTDVRSPEIDEEQETVRLWQETFSSWRDTGPIIEDCFDADSRLWVRVESDKDPDPFVYWTGAPDPFNRATFLPRRRSALTKPDVIPPEAARRWPDMMEWHNYQRQIAAGR